MFGNFGSTFKSLQKEVTNLMDDFGISGSSITSGFGYGSSGSGLKFSGGMPTSKTYISGIPPRTVKTETNYRSTIRDTGRGQATTSAFVPKKTDQDNTFDKIKAQCIASGRKWEDPDFPATASSLYFRNPPSAWPNIQWKRPHEICRDPQLYVAGGSRMDVIQGILGDCWLLAAVASLTSNEQLLHKVAPPDQSFQSDYAGIFRFFFWQYGRWVEVLIDDRLPTQNNKLIYMHSEERNEFWSALLEKAYAKICGSYEGLSGGLTSEALTDFTGGVVERFELRSKAPADLFQQMLKAHAKGSLMGCSIDAAEGRMEAQLANGLIIGHAYSITDVRMIHVQTARTSGAVQMVRIRNPWGDSHEWKGAWSDGSVEWTAVSATEKAELGLSYEHDGEFWMSYKDFVGNYQKLEICYLGPDSLALEEEKQGKRKFEGKLFEGSWRPRVNAGGCRNYPGTFWTNPQYRVKIVDPDPADNDGTGTILIGVMQKERRKMKKEGKDMLTIGYAVYKAPPTNSGTLDKSFFDRNTSSAKSSAFSNLREVSDHHKLPPGEYVIVPSTFEPNESGDFIMRIYSESANQQAEELDDATGTVDIKKSVIVPKAPEDKKLKEEGRQAFINMAGADGEIDAFELQNILNATFKREFAFDGFTTDMTRSMVAMMDADFSGKIGFEEFKKLWADLTLCKRTFKMADTDSSGYFNSYEFKSVLNTIGFRISNATFNAIVMRYSDKSGYVRFNDFVACYIKLKTLFETFAKRDPANDGRAKFGMDEIAMPLTTQQAGQLHSKFRYNQTEDVAQ